MSDAHHHLRRALDRLAGTAGFAERPMQRQLAFLILDCLQSDSAGLFEAPTGLGKSFAALLAALTHAHATGERIVIATYTNVLTEQYWRQDLPQALNLLDRNQRPTASFLIGRQNYVCQAALEAANHNLQEEFGHKADLGIVSELRRLPNLDRFALGDLWRNVQTPPACEVKLCTRYNDCYYYRARKQAEHANVVITNHSTLLQDALIRAHTHGETRLLGAYDALIVDEAHDFAQATVSALTFEVNAPLIRTCLATLERIERTFGQRVEGHHSFTWQQACGNFRVALQEALRFITNTHDQRHPGILKVSPPELATSPRVSLAMTDVPHREVHRALEDLVRASLTFVGIFRDQIKASSLSDEELETFRAYALYLEGMATGCASIQNPEGIAVSYLEATKNDRIIRRTRIDIADALRNMLWQHVPSHVLMSATLTLDGRFNNMSQKLGVRPRFAEALPSPFNYARHCALYLPPHGHIPDPGLARQNKNAERAYHAALANELTMIILAFGGRTLALFHSRQEMEAVYLRMRLPKDLPLLKQESAVASVGEQFRAQERASLFALRSFWTGFDAPGTTLSCVVLVRIPFEVPNDPMAIVREAWLRLQGEHPFLAHTLPEAKMLVRQGAGRLIRSSQDRGVIALLDPRFRSMNYGQEMVANLPTGLRHYDDLFEAMAAVNIDVNARPPY